jgi:hypothetical protein
MDTKNSIDKDAFDLWWDWTTKGHVTDFQTTQPRSATL